MIEYLKSIKTRDSSDPSLLEILLFYPTVFVMMCFRIARIFEKIHFTLISTWIMQIARRRTGIEIHPKAKIGKNLFIDHGMGVVIGETAIIGDNCLIYQGVTLGARCSKSGKRHPTIGNNVMIGAGAKILGDIIINDGSKIGSMAIVLKDVPKDTTIVGLYK